MSIKPRINIYDVDTTTITGESEQAYDIVFVPGFASSHLFDNITSSVPKYTVDNKATMEEIKADFNKAQIDSLWFDTMERNEYKLTKDKSMLPYIAKSSIKIDSTNVVNNEEDILAAGLWLEKDNTLKQCNEFIAAEYSSITPEIDHRIDYASDGKTYDVGDRDHLFYKTSLINDGDIVNLFKCIEDPDNPGTYKLNDAVEKQVKCFNQSGKINGLTEYPSYPIYLRNSATGNIFIEQNIIKYATKEYDKVYTFTANDLSVASDDNPVGMESINCYSRALDKYYYADGENAACWYWDKLKSYTDPVSYNQSIKYTTLADFYKAVGTTPLTVYNYTNISESSINFDDEDGKNITIAPNGVYQTVLTKNQFAKLVEPNATAMSNINAVLKSWSIEIAFIDENWVYAAMLLSKGLQVCYNVMADETESGLIIPFSFNLTHIDPMKESDLVENTEKIFDDKFIDMYAELADKGEYDIKYITTGVFGLDFNETVDVEISDEKSKYMYPFYDVSVVDRKKMSYLVDIANFRKDAIAFLDTKKEYCVKHGLYTKDSAYQVFSNMVLDDEFVNDWNGESYTEDERARSGRKATNIYPWAEISCDILNAIKQYRGNKGKTVVLPGSYIYLSCLAESLQKYPSASWQSIAGVTRALVPDFEGLYINERLSNAVADAYNKRNLPGINAITNIRPYGYSIWGNRTLCNQAYFAALGDGTDGLVASSFIDIISMVCNVSKVAYRAAKSLMFEKNNDILWVRFRQQIDPYLNDLQISGAIKTYEVKKEPSTMRGQLVAKIILYSNYSVENFDISVVLRDAEEVEA